MRKMTCREEYLIFHFGKVNYDKNVCEMCIYIKLQRIYNVGAGQRQ